MNSRVLSRIEKRIRGQCFVMHRKEFCQWQKGVLSVDRIEFCHGQKKVLSWTENSSVSTRGRERDLSRTEKSFNMRRKKSRHEQRKFGHGSCGPP